MSFLGWHGSWARTCYERRLSRKVLAASRLARLDNRARISARKAIGGDHRRESIFVVVAAHVNGQGEHGTTETVGDFDSAEVGAKQTGRQRKNTTTKRTGSDD